KAHAWPGNIRELQNVIERAVILCGEDGYIQPDLLGINAPLQLTDDTPAPTLSSSSALTDNGSPTQTLADIEKVHILTVLRHCEYNRTQAAKTLDINIRTLRNKLNEYKAAGESVDA
ncbi:MAG: sigma-54-dependent Fis family transcriptional regulator, partial [Verrucomicrobiales bacterium]|nr:sigma-54-dependent Fis family transcriptional regulator [Verrucomicrobiales bacterium]